MELIKQTVFRKIIDPDGTFQMLIPPTWRYWVMENRVHSFEDNESHDDDCFQLSVMAVTEAERTNLAENLSYLPPTQVGDFDCRAHKDSKSNGLITKAWSTVYGYYHVYFSFTYKPHYKKEYRQIELENKLKVVFTVFSSFDMLPEEHRDQIVTSHRFQVFLQGMGATNLLVKKAVENKAFFEATCLFGNQIDSLLRIGIVLKKQLLNNNDLIEREWIYQGPSDKKKSEKDVYKTALSLGIITDDLYKELSELYEDRNRVIHRFIISEITLAEVEQIAYDYYFLREDIKIIVDNLETEQVNNNIGMTTSDENDPGNRSPNLTNILGKIGTVRYFEEA
ncbi:hypothetical protein [Mucilaginibacter sp. UYCu711]|uniref:hypothetical protein n=1 Tax=Mucilaginibacter sp. UYCu711 TaxID=3156339 RepID=UPI003D2199D9